MNTVRFPDPLSRRRFFKTAFCSSMALALNLRRSPAVETDAPDAIHLLALGDFGSGTPEQAAVAAAMQTYMGRMDIVPHWLLLLGDNFYSNKSLGGGMSEARWKSGFEEMYPAARFPGPCPAVLGNHDYHDTVDGPAQQLGYAARQKSRWHMPAKWYRMDLGKTATFLFLDTNLRSLSGAKPGKRPKACLSAEEESVQWTWLERELEQPRAPFTFVVGHHPVYSNGSHGDSPELVQRLAPLLQKSGVHFSLAGHDHDLQHLELDGRKTSFLISGGGGAGIRQRLVPKHPATFDSATHGFSHIVLQPDRVRFTHVNARAEPVHSMEKLPDHRWKTPSA